MAMDYSNIKTKINSFVLERNWDQFHSVKNLSMALSVEASELVEIFQWQSEEKSNSLYQDEIEKEKISDEVADIFIYLTRICEKNEIDLEKAVLKKIEKNAQKYPADLAFGSIKKYNQLKK